MSDHRVYGMGKSCSWLVVACNTAKVSVGQNFASIFITMKEMAPVYLGQVMNRSWVKYGMAMDGLLEGRGDFFLPPFHTLVAVSICLDI